MPQKTSKILFIGFVFLSFIAKSQKPAVSFGKIPIEDLQKTSYAIDTTAEAITLFEKVTTRFYYDESMGLHMDSEIHIRKKILKKSALDQANVALGYYKGNSYEAIQSIFSIEASTYNLENNSIVKTDVKGKDVFEERKTENWFYKKFTFPKVTEGSIIEYKYVKRNPFRVQDKPDTWYFQGSNPCLWSEIDILVPDWFYYQVIMGGYLPLALRQTTRSNCEMGHSKLNVMGNAYNFAVANAPAFKNEPYITCKDDFLSKVEFELSLVRMPDQIQKSYSLDWPSLDKTLSEAEYLGQRLKKSNYLNDYSTQFNNQSDALQKAKAMYYKVQEDFITDKRESIYCGDLKKVLTNKKGSASEINMLLTAMLKNKGLNANPLIISTRDNGRINENFALIDRFNHIVCYLEIEDKHYFLDASNKIVGFGNIPINNLNGNGRLIVPDGNCRFIPLQNSDRHFTSENILMAFDTKTNKLKADVTMSTNGYAAQKSRTLAKSEKGKDLHESLNSNLKEWSIDSLEVTNLDSLEKILDVKFKMSNNEPLDDQDILYITPILTSKIEENPFKQSERLFPVNFGYLTDHLYNFKLKVPKGYKVESIPQSSNILLPENAGQFFFKGYNDTETNEVVIQYKISLKKTEYAADFYPAIKELFNIIAKKQDEMVVLKKM